MGFSAKQTQALRRNPGHHHIRTRQSNGRELSYIEGWYAICEANRIFGFDGWSRETIESRNVLNRETRGSFLAIYIARVRITVQADGATIVREGHGSGEGRGPSPGEVHDIALKAAETDATKRALATFGKPFGLALYANGKARTASEPAAAEDPAPAERMPNEPGSEARFAHDDTTPIPRPSRYYGREHYHARREQAQSRQPVTGQTRPTETSIVTPAPDLAPGRIDKSALTIGEPKRLRDKAHLKFVASHPCLVCGRQPSDPHHLRFAQARAIGLKVSDEFTVPLCRGHHRELHQVGNEVTWWERLRIAPLPVAKELWEQSHARLGPTTDTRIPGSESGSAAGHGTPPQSKPRPQANGGSTIVAVSPEPLATKP